ncbi:VapC toxin [Oleiphilus messinensis]|uniref:VapC toxin n=1 Tax=Oleiphilus messinensis TaxID=141451 RepID=A0A1Y0I9N1_9GAMM|nr:PIN domain nuclease [Oleiphilus messinensis]ARU57232.1 VapC toxin [Oleiphilus messinensis]
MILVDTSVWIDYFNKQENVQTNILDAAIIDGTVAMGDLIFLEILQGFRDDKDYKKVKTHLATLDQYELFGKDMVFKSAENYRALRKKGITIRATTDVIIATYCIENDIPLLFIDKDFKPFVKHLGLISAAS